MLTIQQITVEYRKKALGLDATAPVISYILESDGRDVVQTAVQIRVRKGDTVVYDSGRMETSNTILHRYAGEPLCARTEYAVEVAAEDNRGERAVGAATFETGLLLQENPTSTQFITHGFADETVCPILVKEFHCGEPIRRARIYASALGVYDLHINGKRVGDCYFTPYWTSYSHTLEYQTYDVTDLLGESNRLEMTLADGWYKGDLTWLRKRNLYGDRLAGWLELYVEYASGRTQVIRTDESWHSERSQILSTSFYDGEVQDTAAQSVEREGVAIYPHATRILVSQLNEPVRKRERLSVKEKMISPRGEILLDFGQNLTGWVEFVASGRKGQRVTLRFAEVLDKYGNLYTENLRTAKATDVFILNGKKQKLIPRFTFHGFRYCAVEGLDEVDPAAFEAVALYSDFERAGWFSCSDADINQLYSNQLWSNRGNFLDLPTDCPQRDERLGWTADAMIYCRTASTNFHTYLFYRKWLRDVASEQTREYGVPHIVPNPLEKTDAAGAAWSDAAVMVPWTLYWVYGDRRILQEQYKSMCGWVDFITRHTDAAGLWKTYFQFGDWLGLDMHEFSDRTGATDKYFIANVFYLQSARIVRETAGILGKERDAKHYARLCEKLLKAIQDEYITKTGRLVSETQTAYVLALTFSVVPEKFREKFVNALADDVRTRGHFMTGFLGTPYICFALTDNGKQELADVLLRREKYPSWLYPIRNGATTMWERWNSRLENGDFNPGDMNSFNHCAYGTIAEWMYRRLAGIDALEPGYRKIRICPVHSKGFYDYSRSTATASDEVKPVYVPGIDRVEGKIECPYGEIYCGVDYVAKRMQVRIPIGATAEIVLPDGRTFETGSGSYEYTFEVER